MICKKCGKEIPDHSLFCEYCGEPSAVKKRSKKPFVMGGSIIGLILVVCGVIFAMYYTKRQRQEADIDSANMIASSIKKVLMDEGARADMQQYTGNVISVEEEMKYLPQSFQDKFEEKCEDVPELQYTKDGATGFSFRIDDNGKVTVYISSDDMLDEWRIYPELSERYFSGEKQEISESAEVIRNKEYSYVRLISRESPILGYWQGKSAGMYVGYDTTEEKEGFVIYLYTKDKWVQVLHSYDGYSVTGELGKLHYGKDGCTVDVIVQDDTHITVRYQEDNGEEEEKASEYTLTKGELDDSLMERFGGTWKCGISDWADGPDCEITYDNGYHFTSQYADGGAVIQCVHEKTEMDGSVINPTIVLYNGVDTLCFLSPYGQMDVQEGYCFDLREFCENDGKLEEKISIVNADGGVYELYREDSAEFKMQEILLAYEEYVNDLDADYEDKVYYTYRLIYVDDDEIPELVILPANGCILCTYKDGEVEQLVNSSATWLNYIEKSGYYMYGGMMDAGFFGKLEGGVATVLAYRMWEYNEDADLEGDYSFYIGDDEVSEEEYLDYIDTLPDGVVDGMENMYPTIYEAYQNLTE